MGCNLGYVLISWSGISSQSQDSTMDTMSGWCVSTIGHSSPNLGTMLQALKYIIGKEVSLPMDYHICTRMQLVNIESSHIQWAQHVVNFWGFKYHCPPWRLHRIDTEWNWRNWFLPRIVTCWPVVFKAVIKANAGCNFQPVWVATLDQVFLVTHY